MPRLHETHKVHPKKMEKNHHQPDISRELANLKAIILSRFNFAEGPLKSSEVDKEADSRVMSYILMYIACRVGSPPLAYCILYLSKSTFIPVSYENTWRIFLHYTPTSGLPLIDLTVVVRCSESHYTLHSLARSLQPLPDYLGVPADVAKRCPRN